MALLTIGLLYAFQGVCFLQEGLFHLVDLFRPAHRLVVPVQMADDKLREQDKKEGKGVRDKTAPRPLVQQPRCLVVTFL